MYVDFSLYFFATSAVIFLPFIYSVWKKWFVLALFIVASIYLTILFDTENDPTYSYTLVLAICGFALLVMEHILGGMGGRDIGVQRITVPDMQPRIYPKMKPMRHLATRQEGEIVVCQNCGGHNPITNGVLKTVCRYCGSLIKR